MRKLKLRIEGLEVESFATGTGDARRGTVEAQECGPRTFCQTECFTDATFCPCSELPTLCPCTA